MLYWSAFHNEASSQYSCCYLIVGERKTHLPARQILVTCKLLFSLVTRSGAKCASLALRLAAPLTAFAMTELQLSQADRQTTVGSSS